MSDKEQCVICGSSEALTLDHVPPKCLFPKPRPPSLITVPACKKCNLGASQDDEYFRTMLSFRLDIAANQKFNNTFNSVTRGLKRTEARAFRQTILNSLNEVDLTTQSGIYIKKGIMAKPDSGRLESVLERITRGLFYSRNRQALPPGVGVKTYLDIGLQRVPKKTANDVIDLLEKIIASPPTIIEPDIFRYWTLPVTGLECGSIWLLVFYGNLWSLSITNPIPKDADPQGISHQEPEGTK